MAHHLFRHRQRYAPARHERNRSRRHWTRLAHPSRRGLDAHRSPMRRPGKSGSRIALGRLEGVKDARGRHSATSRRTPRPHLQSRPRHSAGNAGRKCEESGALGARTFRSAFRRPQFMTRIAIIGGGISGLAAAFALEVQRRDRSARVEFVLYESSSRLGGVLHTEHIEGCAVEAGPDSFLTEKPWALDLCRELGLGQQLIGSNDAERKTYILTRGRLVAKIGKAS